MRPSGEAAVVLELGDDIDPAVHDRVLAVAHAVDESPPAGVLEVVPTYRSLLLRLEPTVTTPADVVEELAGRPAPPPARGRRRTHDVRVSFEPTAAEDLDEVAAHTGTTPDEVVGLLTGTVLRLYCYGFVPGFAYLGGVPEAIHLPRRATPRPPVAPGALLLAAGQAALCPTAMPTGWWVVGRTDHRLFDPGQEPPVPFEPGDGIRLVPT